MPGHADSEWGAAIGNTFNDIQTIAGFNEASKFADQAGSNECLHERGNLHRGQLFAEYHVRFNGYFYRPD